jgi:ATP-dependent exoDNAse (exonuclease V) beta subunit
MTAMPDALAERDSLHRQAALDVTRSFLVQAPAGSGKTDLLIQRFLALLARVDRPERVVAMTFTRKAAGEMFERVAGALRAAACGAAGGTAHERRTLELARAALEQDRRCGWNLVAHPARLQVQTIDALCIAIARQAPLTTGLAGPRRFEEQGAPLYREAVRSALAAAAPDDASWRRMLALVDNDTDAAVELLAGMLARREQWLKYLVGREPAKLRADLEGALGAEIAAELERLRTVFPRDQVPAAIALLRYAADNLAPEAARAELACALRRCAERADLPPADASGVAEWVAIAEWLLTGKGQWRAALNAAQGVPAKGGADARVWRARAVDLLARCAATTGLDAVLDATRALPPATFDDASWSTVASILDLLPQLAARLELTFAETGTVDFAQAMLGALAALGDPEAPSDLLLRLDYRVEHLLVDEFQDTSDAQNALIERLTAGWQFGDGRTLFAVGDPMQSIYRFREAEVRLFLHARQARRIGNVPVEPLELARNFRSQANLVAWVNATFPHVFAARDDPWRGAVAHVASAAVVPAAAGPTPTLDLFADPAGEAAGVVERVRRALSDGVEDVAILVRARSHLDRLLPALQAARIAYAAVELESLAERQAILDLLSLTHALAQPADRLAWLALLRVPWCGLALADLFAVAREADDTDWASVLASTEPLHEVSPEGRSRLTRLAAAMVPALRSRGRATLAARVRGAWLALGGPALCDDALDLAATERFFALLAAHESAGDLANYDALLDALDELKATPDDAAEARVKVMTLHKAKGLEFDTVILPALERIPHPAEERLLLWRMRPQGLLLAPRGARGDGNDRMYGYLKRLDRDESDAELARLLYVGCTRARARLHLSAAPGLEAQDGGVPRWKDPPSGSALAKIAGALAGALPGAPDPAAGAATEAFVPPTLARLPLDWRPPPPEESIPLSLPPSADEDTARVFDWAQVNAAAIGTVAHRWLAQLGRDGLAHWSAARVDAARARIEAELAYEGIDAADLPAAHAAVANVVTRVLADPRGRWLFDPTHEDAASELALAGADAGALVHVSLDRTFVADGVRWVVDFKTGTHAGGDAATFLDREVERYRDQLDRYARIVRGLDPRPIRLGLYYPLVDGGWREWPTS